MANRYLLLLLLGMVLELSVVFGEGTPVAKIGQSGEFLELEQNGQTIKDYLPLHRTAGVRHFSAGVGVEERSAVYPPFSLKIIMTAGGKPFLADVAVTIQPVKGGSAIAIPRDQVQGPWLFVDLAPGLYEVSATDGDHIQRLKEVKVEAGKQKVIYLRWAEDHGIAGRVPAE
jgi:hypothetical protein